MKRQRTLPRWRSGLRRGTARLDAKLAFLRSPLMMEILREADERLRAWGVEPMRLTGVRQPFDYAPRIVGPRIH
jgi:hypothetical protein